MNFDIHFNSVDRAERQTSVYIPMPDGVKIAVDIWLPDDFVSGDKVPVAVEFTRYWRIAEGVEPKERTRVFAKYGVASAIVDCRGTGASFGYRAFEHSASEAADFAPIIEWLAIQAWSNGSVVSIGASYSANTAEFALFNAPSSLRGAIPRYSDFDAYAHIGFPGGLLNKGLLLPWGEGIRAMDLNETSQLGALWEGWRNKSVKPVDGDEGKRLLLQAVSEHQRNVSVSEFIGPIEYRDEFNHATDLQQGDQPLSPHLLQNNPRVQAIPSYHVASFADAGTAAGAIARFLGSTAPMRVVIGYWSHSSGFDASPFAALGTEPVPSIEAQYIHHAKYIKALCSDVLHPATQANLQTERALYYFTAGENAWKKTQVWPPEQVAYQQWFLNHSNTLSTQAPSGQATGDTYSVDFDAGTGPYTRWDQTTKTVHYDDRSEQDKQLLTYTSAPLDQAVEITGHPVMTLHLSSTQSDGAVIVYLESVSPDGTVTMLTEGGLRLIHRKVCSETPPYPHFGPYHTFEKKDASAMPIGEQVEVGFECLPLSVQIPNGHALRVAIAGHDKDCFDRLPETGAVTLNIFRHANALSSIALPIRYLGEQAPKGSNPSVNPFQF